jgi:molybdate transport system substrate-binding protein
LNLFISAIVGSGLTVALTQSAVTPPATIKVLTTRAIATVLDKAGAEFEQNTGYNLEVTRDIAIRMVRRIQTGETFDLLVASPEQIAFLVKEGKIIAETRTKLARSGIGIEVRAGTPKPDISTVEAFKRALLSAKSIAYLKEGQSGIYLDSLIKRLRLAEAIKPKVVRPDTDIVSELVAKGEVELGLVVITQIMTTKGVELVGPLPPEVQSYIVFAAGVSTNSKAPGAAKELMKFLTGPRAISVMRAQGMEPWSDVTR